MTILQMQSDPHLLAPLSEDLMELTPDIDQRAGGTDEIDIDLDLTGDNQLGGEEEFMSEEDMDALVASTSEDGQGTHGVNDNEMTDNDYVDGLRDEDTEVIENPEYTGLGLDDDNTVEPDSNHPNEQNGQRLASYAEITEYHKHEQGYQEQGYNEQEHHKHANAAETQFDVVERALPNKPTNLLDANNDFATVATEETSAGYHLEISREATTNSGAANRIPEVSDVESLVAPDAKTVQLREAVLQASLNQDAIARSNIEDPHTRGDDPLNLLARLHPIVLNYQGDEMFLFPPVDPSGEHAATFLLADEQLAYSTIGNLFEACRHVLKGSLSEQDELFINVHDLDLHISESTIECASTRLSEVVDLYSRLQENDGLENPPPLYIDLSARNRFSCRLQALRNSLIEGAGLSQLKMPPQTEVDQHRTEEGADPSTYITVRLDTEAYALKRQPREEAEGSIDLYDSHGYSPPSETVILGTDSGVEGTQSDAIRDIVLENKQHAESLLGGDSVAHEASVNDDPSSEATGSKESLESAQSLANDAESHKEDESIVDKEDYIDYEDVAELKGDISSASSTLQGDTIDVHTVLDRPVPNEPDLAQVQEHRSPPNLQGDTVAHERVSQKYVDKTKTSDHSSPMKENQPNLAASSSQYLDKGRNVSAQFDNEGKASVNGQDISISQGTKSQLEVDADEQHEFPAQYQDNPGTSWPADPIDGDVCPLADTDNNREIEDHSRHPLDFESSRSPRGSRDDDLEGIKDWEAENELEEADALLVNDDSDDVPQLLEEVNTRPSLSAVELVQMQEDDDEITYEDEEYDYEPPLEPVATNLNAAITSESLKRARSLHEDKDIPAEDLQGFKRVRSG